LTVSAGQRTLAAPGRSERVGFALFSTATMVLSEAFLDRLIANQHRAIRYYLVFALGLVLLGLAIALFALRSSTWIGTDAVRTAFGIGGGFVSTLGAFPLKEYLTRRERVELFEEIKARLAARGQAQEPPDQPEGDRLDKLLWQVVEKTALG
jgi:hypothetical protein